MTLAKILPFLFICPLSWKRKAVSRTEASEISVFELAPAQKWTRDVNALGGKSKGRASDYKQKRLLSDETKWTLKERQQQLSELTGPWRPQGQG